MTDPTPEAPPSAPVASLTRRASDLAEAFAAEFGARAEGVWCAPGRANLIGEHTDYNAGFALPFGIERRALVAVRRRSDQEIRLCSKQTGHTRLQLSEAAPGRLSGWAAYVAGAAWAVQQAGSTGTGFELLLDSDVPMGAGLSSSAAVECASVLALSELWGLALDRPALARLAQRVEVEVAGVPCGLMDQLTSMCAQPDRVLFFDFRSMAIEALDLPLDEAELELLVIDTRSPHELASGHYAERRQACQRVADTLGVNALRDATLDMLESAAARLSPIDRQRGRHVVTENARVLAAVALLGDARTSRSALGLTQLGPLLSASHASLRDDFEVTVPHLDVTAEAAEQAGALGARMMGGGFGGSVLALIPHGASARVMAAVHAAFSARGWEPPRSVSARRAGGAARLL